MLKNKNIGFYVEDGRFSGPHNYIIQISKALIKNGFNVVIFAPRHDSDFFINKLKKEGINYVLLDICRLTKEKKMLFKYLLRFPVDLFLIYSAVKKQKIDIINIAGGIWQFKGVLASLITKSKIVWRLNDTDMPKAIKNVFYWLSPYVDAIIVNGSRVYNYYINDKVKNKNIFNIQSPVDTKYFSPLACKCDNAEYEPIVITTIGNISERKGFEHFVMMADKLSNSPYSLVFNIAGAETESQRKYIDNLKSLISKSNAEINLLGMVEDTRELLCKSDIYICPSVSEASPNSVWQAMSMGKVIISTDVGDASVMIKNGEHGYIVETSDSQLLHDRVLFLIENRHLWKKLGFQARKRSERMLSIDTILDEHLTAYASVI